MKKTLAAVLICIITFGAFSFLATASAMPLMKWRVFDNMPMRDRMSLQQSFVRLNGMITKWGDTNVTGTVSAQSRTVIVNGTTVKEGSSAYAVWTTNQSRPINGIRDRENFTYTFYAAHLINVTESSLNKNGYSYYLTGVWNVFNVTTTFTIVTNSAGNIVSFNRNQNAVALLTKADGEFAVSNGANFTLTITGTDPLTGSVRIQRITSKMFNPFIIEDNVATTVTKADVKGVAMAFGASPGWGNYDQRMDYNFNFKIDICDLATAAANLNR